MASTRKTLDREALVASANRALASDGTTEEQRSALSSFVAGVLLDGNAYKGFRYLSSEFADGLDGERHLREDYDRTRVAYY